MLNYLDNKTLSKNIKELMHYVKNTNYKYKNEIIHYLTEILNNNYQLYCDIDTFKNILNIIILNNQNSDFLEANILAQHIYKTNVPLEPTDIDLKNFYNLYNVLLKSNYNTIFKSAEMFINISDIYNSFENKNLVLFLFERIGNIPSPKININNCLDCIKDYVIKSRIYYTDEHAYLNVIINLLNSYFFNNEINSEDYEKNKKLNIEQLRLDKKLAGIYDIDEEKIKELEEKIKILEDKIDKSSKDIFTLNKNSEVLKENSDINFIKNIYLFNKIFNSQEDILITKLQTINPEFKVFTNNKKWFTIYVINTFGFEFVANSNIYQQEFISYIVNNNLLEKWKELLIINPNFNFNENIFWFKEDTIRILGIEYLANTSLNTQRVISEFSNMQLELLKKILSINPKFEFYQYPFLEINYRLIIDNYVFDKLGIEYIANASLEQILTVFAFYHSNCDYLSKLEKILILNSKFSINFKSNISPTDKSLTTFIKNNNETELIQFLSNENCCRVISWLSSKDAERLCVLPNKEKQKLLSTDIKYELDGSKKLNAKLERLEKNKTFFKLFKFSK